MKLGVNLNISNEDYHADRDFLSSSAFKMLLKDPKEFYDRYILNKPEEIKNSSALNFGTVAHLMLLEPHLYASNVVVYPGVRRAGKEFETFRTENENKLILTRGESESLMAMKSSFENNPHSGKLFDGCDFEYSITSEYEGIPVKCRADAINIEKGYIIDVKTTGYASGADVFKDTLFSLYYDLSAALYCEIAKSVYGRPFDFYYCVLSKADLNCSYYKTSKDTYCEGLERLLTSIETYKKCLLTGVWEVDNVETEEQDNNLILEV